MNAQLYWFATDLKIATSRRAPRLKSLRH